MYSVGRTQYYVHKGFFMLRLILVKNSTSINWITISDHIKDLRKIILWQRTYIWHKITLLVVYLKGVLKVVCNTPKISFASSYIFIIKVHLHFSPKNVTNVSRERDRLGPMIGPVPLKTFIGGTPALCLLKN